MKSAARVDDTHKCDKHGGEKIIEGSPNVFINNKPTARQGDHAKCKSGEKAVIKSGSSSVMINGKPAARQDDPTDHDGKITSGSNNVKIGSGGNPVNFGNKGTINIGGNGKEVNIGKAVEEAAIENIGLGEEEIVEGIPLDEIGVGEAMQIDGVRRIVLSTEQLKNLKRFIKKIPANVKKITIKNLPKGEKSFRAESAGKVLGSKAIYEKQIDVNGNTISYTKTTYDPFGKVVHQKDKF